MIPRCVRKAHDWFQSTVRLADGPSDINKPPVVLFRNQPFVGHASFTTAEICLQRDVTELRIVRILQRLPLCRNSPSPNPTRGRCRNDANCCRDDRINGCLPGTLSVAPEVRHESLFCLGRLEHSLICSLHLGLCSLELRVELFLLAQTCVNTCPEV